MIQLDIKQIKDTELKLIKIMQKVDQFQFNKILIRLGLDLKTKLRFYSQTLDSFKNVNQWILELVENGFDVETVCKQNVQCLVVMMIGNVWFRLTLDSLCRSCWFSKL